DLNGFGQIANFHRRVERYRLTGVDQNVRGFLSGEGAQLITNGVRPRLDIGTIGSCTVGCERVDAPTRLISDDNRRAWQYSAARIFQFATDRAGGPLLSLQVVCSPERRAERQQQAQEQQPPLP